MVDLHAVLGGIVEGGDGLAHARVELGVAELRPLLRGEDLLVRVQRGRPAALPAVSDRPAAFFLFFFQIVLRYLTRRADRGAGEPTEAPASDGSIQDKILQANPVLEAFGNAKTLRNNNSSRFGKYFTIDFSQSGGVVSGTLTDYLLEKSRVVSQAEGERNYHIFYQLCAGAPAELKAQLGIGDAASHNYTKTCVQNDTDDLADWVEMDEALSLFAEAQTKTDVYRIVGALLNLGDVAFEAAGEASQVSSAAKGALGRAAKLIKVDAERLMLALCERSITTGKGRSTYTIKLKPEDAVSNRDALAKEVYSRLFSWLVHHIDAGMHLESKQGSSSRKASIGVLDIFGFEVLATNSLEQMLINYTNEKLHFQFCHYYFTLEQHEYEKEGVTWESIEFCDNAACLSLLERKLGVFDVLQDACRQPKTDDTTFADNLKGTLISDPNFGRAKFDPTGFTIHHFARSVEYSSHGMLEKNKDQLFTDLELVLTLSEDKFLQELQGGGKLSRGTAVAGATVARQFTESINKLMATLNATQPHYIRCIKCVTLKTMNAPQCCEHVWVAA